jgi:molybdopterin adenylyltransferase
LITTIRCAVITISDRSSQGLRDDLSGPALVKQVNSLGWSVNQTAVIPDDRLTIQNCLQELVGQDQTDLILTTGGTGCAPRDVTPEATQEIIEKNVPGLAEVMRQESIKINAHAMLSRGIAGISKNTLIVNLPGSPKAAVECLSFIEKAIPHAISLIRSDAQSEAGHQLLK